jgi:ubiquinone/menaquinone biosynthesis C-methylase UbiE
MSEAAPARQQYDRLAGDYDRRWRPYIDATLHAVLEAVPLDGREALLDAPCGTGELEPRLLERWPGLHLTGIDVSGAMLIRARGKDVQRRVRWMQADVAALPFAAESFDVIVCANSFHYFRRPEQSLQEFRRVLRSDGALILVDWCDDFLACKLCSVWLRWTDPAFYRTYSLRSCRALLEQAGLEVAAADRFRVGYVWGLMRLVGRHGG